MFRIYGVSGNPKGFPDFETFEEALESGKEWCDLFSISDLETHEYVWSNFLSLEVNKYEGDV